MPDFFQNGSIGTIHQLNERETSELEKNLAQWGKESPIALVIPCLFSELENSALPKIVDELTEASYLSEIVMVLITPRKISSKLLKSFSQNSHKNIGFSGRTVHISKKSINRLVVLDFLQKGPAREEICGSASAIF